MLAHSHQNFLVAGFEKMAFLFFNGILVKFLVAGFGKTGCWHLSARMLGHSSNGVTMLCDID
jgi:hypothetical protein